MARLYDREGLDDIRKVFTFSLIRDRLDVADGHLVLQFFSPNQASSDVSQSEGDTHGRVFKRRALTQHTAPAKKPSLYEDSHQHVLVNGSSSSISV